MITVNLAGLSAWRWSPGSSIGIAVLRRANTAKIQYCFSNRLSADEVYLDILASIAEISVAFAGFASIITALSGRRFGEMERGNLTRFQLMIYSSLSATLVALLPYLMVYNAESVDWWLCILLLTIYLIVFLAVMIRVFIVQVTQGLLSGRVALAVVCLGVLATFVQLLSLMSILEPDLGIYLFGVYYLLIQSGVSFTRLITAALRS